MTFISLNFLTVWLLSTLSFHIWKVRVTIPVSEDLKLAKVTYLSDIWSFQILEAPYVSSQTSPIGRASET